MDKKLIKESLRNRLPRGFTKTIQDALSKKGKTVPSKAWVSRVCNPDTTNWDVDIIAEALDLAKNESVTLNSLTQKAESL